MSNKSCFVAAANVAVLLIYGVTVNSSLAFVLMLFILFDVQYVDVTGNLLSERDMHGLKTF